MHKFSFWVAFAMAIFFFATVPTVSSAVVLTFDDHQNAHQNAFGNLGSYNGFSFTPNLDWIDTVGSGWNYGSVSGDYTMLNNNGGAGYITESNGDDFIFSGMYAKTWGGAASRIGNILGYNDGDLVWSAQITLTSGWAFFSGTDVLIDSLTLNLGNFFLVDNLALNETPASTPIPGAVWLLGSGILGLVGVRRKMNA